MTERLRALRERLATPVDATGLAMFRILFGLLVSFGALRFLWNGWVDELYVAPRFHFHYLGFDWVRVWPGWGMHAHFAALAALGLLVALGAFYRPAIVALFLAFTYVELLDVTVYLNHYYLVSLLALLLCFLPAAATWSVDAARRPGARSDTVPLAAPVALRLQIGLVYVFAGLAKLGEDWLVHAQPLNIWLSSRAELPGVGPLLGDPRVALAMGWAGFLYDTTIPLWLSLRRTRLVAFVVLLGFHGATGLLFPIGLFPLIMTSGALIFFPQDLPRRVLARLSRRAPAPPAVGASRGPLPALALAALAIHVAVQVLVPLRHHLYGGDVLWHEQGMRFSWKVMVREKNASLLFVARSPSTGRVLHVAPSRYLTPLQEREIATQPDLVLQLAHRVRDDLRGLGLSDVEVRAEVFASLNGRPAARLVDPSVDLSKVEDGLLPFRWVLPAPAALPPRLERAAARASSPPGEGRAGAS